MRASFMIKESQRKRKMENGNSKNEMRDSKIACEKTHLTQSTRRPQRRRKSQTKKSRTKSRSPRKRRMAGPLTRRRGNRVIEPTKETGMALKRDSPPTEKNGATG